MENGGCLGGHPLRVPGLVGGLEKRNVREIGQVVDESQVLSNAGKIWQNVRKLEIGQLSQFLKRILFELYVEELEPAQVVEVQTLNINGPRFESITTALTS